MYKDKDFYRKTALIQRNELSNRGEKDCVILKKVIELLSSRQVGTLFSYVSMGSEVDTRILLDKLFGQVDIYVTMVVDRIMYAIKADSRRRFSFESDKLGNVFALEELSEQNLDAVFDFDVTLVPMLAFNSNGFRLGYGGGYYDSFLSKSKSLKIGLAYDEQQNEDIIIERHDVPLDIILTPTRTIGRL